MSMTNIFTMPLSGLSDDEQAQVSRMLDVIAAKALPNSVKEKYYEGKQRVRDLNIAIPPSMRSVETVVGWPGTVVDVLEERLDLEGFDWSDGGGGDDDRGIDEVWEQNHLATESGQGNLDALIYGVAYIAVGTGFDGEPNPLVTVESPKHMTAVYDPRTRRLSAALSRVWDADHGRASAVTLYLPDETIRASRSASVEGWVVDSRDRHMLGRVPVSRLVNRPRSGDVFGRSEITRAIITYTNNAVRTVLGMEVAREFYGAPQRYILGAQESASVDADGQPRAAWETYLGRYLAVEQGQADDGTPLPVSVGQFPAASMSPYQEQVRMLAEMVAAEAAIPTSYLGFHTENPPSADSIRALEARLVKRAERRQTGFGAGWVEAMNLALLVRDGTPPPPGLFSIWRDASTPTKAAATDSVVKLIQAGVLSPRSEVTLELLGFSETTRKRLLADGDGGAVQLLMDALAAGATSAPIGDSGVNS